MILRVCLFLICFCNLLFGFNIEGITFKKLDKIDRGTISIYLKNETQNSLKIEELYFNDVKTDKIPSDLILWYQLTPPEIEPEKYGELKIKLRWETKKPVKINFKDNYNKTYEIKINPISEKLLFSGIYFDNNYKTVYIYIENQSEEKEKIKEIEINGENKTEKAYIPEKEMEKGEKKIIIVEGEEFKVGDYIFIKLKTEKGKEIYSLQRVYTNFILEGYGGDTRIEMNFNKDRFDFHYDDKKLEKFKEYPSYMACHIFDDPACVDGIKLQLLGTSADEIIKKIEKFYKYDKIHPTFLYGCEHRKPENYFIYSGLVDIFVVDPYEIIYYHNPPEKNAYYTHLAKISCQPKILWTIPEAFTYRGTRFPTPEEERIIVYSEIGEGSKGIWYFVYNKDYGYPANKPLEEEIKKINWELQKLKEYIAISEPVKLTEKNIEKTTTYTLLCGDRGIILILINNDHESYFEENREPFKYQEKTDEEIEIKIPTWLKINKVKEIEYPEEKEAEYRIKGDKLKINIETLKITKQYLIETERK